jgi:aminoglycoside phosphotransferase family enzyme/predicted kinase
MAHLDFLSLLKQMQQPEFYPHPVKEPIELVQTHASAVFLTGDYAYKLKKPVNFGFLDYSTLSQREYFLNQELQLNKPVAPDIYLEVLPITQSADRAILEGEGKPIEFVLRMNQFPEANLLLNLFNAGKLANEHLIELGKVVAKFHAQAKTSPDIQNFGDIQKIKKSIDENYAQTEQYIGIAQTQKQYDETRHFTDNFLAQKKDWFELRQKSHKIRECHGDLHLKNICLWHNKIQLFDRIEFNEEFRFVDVMYDVAFTVMDLDARERRDFSNLFLNTYLEQSGDWQGLQVLPLYLSRQAYVRAKVTSMLLEDSAVSAEQKQEAITTASNYYKLAWQYTKKPQGKLILMSGLSGSGKTTVARELAPKINAIHLRSDAVRKHLAGIPLDFRGDDSLYTSEMTDRTYHRLLELGKMLVSQGYSTILDAKFDRRIWREKALEIAESEAVPCQIIYCTAPVAMLRDRLTQRTGDISDATSDLLVQQQAIAEAFTEVENAHTITIDTSQTDWLAQFDSWT